MSSTPSVQQAHRHAVRQEPRRRPTCSVANRLGKVRATSLGQPGRTDDMYARATTPHATRSSGATRFASRAAERQPKPTMSRPSEDRPPRRCPDRNQERAQGCWRDREIRSEEDESSASDRRSTSGKPGSSERLGKRHGRPSLAIEVWRPRNGIVLRVIGVCLRAGRCPRLVDE